MSGNLAPEFLAPHWTTDTVHRPRATPGGAEVDGYIQALPVHRLSLTELHREVARLARRAHTLTDAEFIRARTAQDTRDARLAALAR